MYQEDIYIQQQFKEHFLDGSYESIVIYGVGNHTKVLLENIHDERISGLMDSKTSGQVLFGKKVLTEEEVAELPHVCIVILARNSVIWVIYRRIEAFVTEHSIPVYDINGNRLDKQPAYLENNPCFSLSADELRVHISEADTVSFDIFDTLVCRVVRRPTDVFLLMDAGLSQSGYLFSVERRRAEGELEGENPALKDIYEVFQRNTGESSETVQSLMEMEIATEKRVLKRRESMCRLLSWAKEQGKRVLLISDMYLQSDVLCDILQELGITGWDSLYVSCDAGCEKANGLFDYVKEREKIQGSWLHIGDNGYSDIHVPQALGIHTYQLYSTTDMLEQSIYASAFDHVDNICDSVIYGRFAADIYNDPFGHYGKGGELSVQTAYELGKVLIAPVVCLYMSWLIRSVLNDQCDLILFPSRDGYLFKKLYDEYRNANLAKGLPKSVYLYASRRAAITAEADSCGAIRDIARHDSPETIPDRLRHRLGIDFPEDDFGLDEIPDEVYERALKKCRQEREAYLQYLSDEGLDAADRIGMMDFMAVGTVQGALERLIGKRLKGYYFLRREPDSRLSDGLDIQALYGMKGDFRMDVNLYRYYYFLETVFTSPEPTFYGVDTDGSRHFYKEYRTKEDLHTLREIHDGIIEYCREMIGLTIDIQEPKMSIHLCDAILGFFSADCAEIAPEIMEHFVNVDELMGKRIKDLNR